MYNEIRKKKNILIALGSRANPMNLVVMKSKMRSLYAAQWRLFRRGERHIWCWYSEIS